MQELRFNDAHAASTTSAALSFVQHWSDVLGHARAIHEGGLRFFAVAQLQRLCGDLPPFDAAAPPSAAHAERFGNDLGRNILFGFGPQNVPPAVRLHITLVVSVAVEVAASQAACPTEPYNVGESHEGMC